MLETIIASILIAIQVIASLAINVGVIWVILLIANALYTSGYELLALAVLISALGLALNGINIHIDGVPEELDESDKNGDE